MGLDWNWSGNTVVGANFGWNPLVNFNFILRVELLFDLPCKSIRAFTKENEYDFIQEGGLNDYVHMRRKPISKPFTFQVERYVGVDSLDPLRNGTELILPVLLIVNRYVRGSYQPVRMYVFTGVSVMSKEYGELVADKSGLLTEVTTLAYKEMYCIDNPFTSIVGDYWEFDPKDRDKKSGKPNMDGKNKKVRNARTLKDATGTEEARQSAFETEAKNHQWRFHDDSELTATKAGKGTQSAVHLQTTASDGTTKIDAEPLRSTMEGLAKKWKFNGTDVAGAGTRSAQDPTDVVVDSFGTMGKANVAKKKWEEEAKKHRWELDQQRKEGNTRRSSQSRSVREETKAALEGKSSRWEFSEQLKDGNMKQSAATAGKEPTKTATARKAVKWRFNSTTKAGNAKQSARNLATIGEAAELSKAAMQNSSQKWAFEELSKSGTGTQSAHTDPNEKAKNSLLAASKKWKFDKASKAGAGERSAKAVEDEMSAKALEARAKKWEFDRTSKAGKGEHSAKAAEDEMNAKALEAKAMKWEFDETSKAGKGEHSANVTADEMNAKALEAAAKKWAFSGQSKAGGGTQSAKHPEKELSLKEMTDRAVKYPPKKSAADIAKFLSKKKK
ncbi:MAG: hypothetical protein E7300_02270 [Lachnospiraceae bacterium]|nr:hypothetical protein [Lachnospiraceae bacterium]